MAYEEQKAAFLTSLARGEKFVSDGPIRVTDVNSNASISGYGVLTTEQLAFWTSPATEPNFKILLDNVESVESAADPANAMERLDVLHRSSGRLLKTTFSCSPEMSRSVMALTDLEADDHSPASAFSFHEDEEEIDDGDDADDTFHWDLEQLASSMEVDGTPEPEPAAEDPWASPPPAATNDLWNPSAEEDLWQPGGHDDPWAVQEPATNRPQGKSSRVKFPLEQPLPEGFDDKFEPAPAKSAFQPAQGDFASNQSLPFSDDDYDEFEAAAARGKKKAQPSLPKIPKSIHGSGGNVALGRVSAGVAGQPRIVIAVSSILLIFIGTLLLSSIGPFASDSGTFASVARENLVANQQNKAAATDAAKQQVADLDAIVQLSTVQTAQNNRALELLSTLTAFVVSTVIIGAVLAGTWFVRSSRRPGDAPEKSVTNDW